MSDEKKDETSVDEQGHVIIDASTSHKHVLLMSYRTKTRSGGADGTNNIRVCYDKVTIAQVEGLARQEISRRIQSACRQSSGLVERIKMATDENPHVVNVSEIVKGVERIDISELVKDMAKQGLSNDEIIEKLLKK